MTLEVGSTLRVSLARAKSGNISGPMLIHRTLVKIRPVAIWPKALAESRGRHQKAAFVDFRVVVVVVDKYIHDVLSEPVTHVAHLTNIVKVMCDKFQLQKNVRSCTILNFNIQPRETEH